MASALEEFSEHGYAGARMELIAKNAGVAKGTVFLHFKDKETLFVELVKIHILPIIETFSLPLKNELSLKSQIESFFLSISGHIVHSRALPIVHLILGEGRRFPELTKLYYDLVISKVLNFMQNLTKEAVQQKLLPPNTPLLEYPQLLFAPLVTSFLWESNFQQYCPIDYSKMLKAHLSILFSDSK